MEIRQYFRSFTEEELASGAELLFSGNLKDIIIRNNPESKGMVREDHTYVKRLPSAGTVELTAKWEEQGLSAKGRQFKCGICLHKKTGLILETSCSCQDYEKDLYGCPHTAALLAEYMIRENGEDIFRGTRLEMLLRNLTGAEDPFLPGAIKRTDERLLSLLKGNEDQSLPVWIEKKRVTETFRISVGLSRDQKKKMLVDLRIGSGKRMLQVKELPELLNAYREEKILTIGKNEFQLGRNFCDAYTRETLDFMNALVSAKEKGLYKNSLFSANKLKNVRYMELSGAEFDVFMEQNNGQTILLEENQELPVELERKGLGVVLRKKNYGATMRITPVEVLFVSGNNVYLYDKEGIFRIPMESTEKAQALLSMLSWRDEMYIRESEIGAVARNILPVFSEYGTVTARGIEREDYEKEIPDFLFQMDYTDDEELTCRPYAVYKRQGFQCMIFDHGTDAVRRNAAVEQEAAKVLMEIFDRMDENAGILISTLNEEVLFSFMLETLPRLEQMGRVVATESLKKRRVKRLPSLRVGVSVQKEHLLLSLKGTGLTPEEMGKILSAYRKRKRYYRLSSGEFVSLETPDGETWNTAAELFENAGGKNPEKLKLPKYRALYLQEMLEEKQGAEFEGSKDYRKLLQEMDPEAEKDSPVPESLKTILRPYQAEGFRWIRMLKRCGLGGILADDMGLGKTLQVLTFLLSEKQAGKTGEAMRSLVICPASLVYNWKKEIEKYAGELSAAVIAGSVEQRKELLKKSLDKDVLITSYDLLKRDVELYQGIHFANEIIDEAQFVKNQKTQAAQSVRLIDSDFRMALTGTPIENYLSELWSIMDYLMEGFLYSYTAFQKDYEMPIVAQKDKEALERLRRMVHPFILRRLKKQVLKELPDKLEESVSIRMEGEQKKLYEAAVEEIRSAVANTSADEFRSGKLEFLAMLTRLRQICCDPALLYEDYLGGSAKLEACIQLVGEAIDGGHKLLIFSQFTSMLDIIEERLHKEEIACHRIDGSVSKEKRMEMVDSFANDDVPVFLISLKAGGTGLNLTAADIVIHYDPWWNKAAQDQATDRTHRIGQTQSVTVYELIMEDSIEERIQGIKEGKAKLVEDVLSGERIGSTAISREDMLALLG